MRHPVPDVSANFSLRRGACAALLALGFAVGTAQAPAADFDRMLAAAQQRGPRAVAGVQALRPLLAMALDLDEPHRLAAINEFFNRRIAYAEDMEVWGRVDYWASPLEMLEKGRGDCEDYALAKYFSLVAAGVPVAKLRMVYVRALMKPAGSAPRAHMVLAYYAEPNGEPLILDNLVGEIQSASQRADLTPVFSFNGEGLWAGPSMQSAGDPLARLSPWREAAAKARAEGF